MNLCRCEKGHFYDKEKYATCPHCAGGSASDDKLTEAFTQDVTVPAGSEKIQPVPPVQPVPSVQAVPPAQTVPPVQPLPPVPPIPPISSLPVTNLSANDVTIPFGVGVNEDTPTEPLESVLGNDDGDDHTVGFFDDIFGEAAGTEKKSSTAAVQTAPVNKVTTPCVGWLIALGGEHIGTDFRLKVGKNFIGRSPKMDIALTDDKSVSRERHAIVVYEPKAHLYLVQPGESSSLVYRNDEVVLTPVKLEAYDMITVGDVNLLFMPLCGERFSWGSLFETMKNKKK